MAVRSVIDVDVNDEAFKGFKDLFDKYQAQLAKMPGQWGAMGKEAKGMRGSFEAVAAALMAQSEQVRRLVKTEKESTEQARVQDKYWTRMQRATHAIADNIARTTKDLLKWTALTSVFSGLAGAGGLWGIDRLALGVGAGRRTAAGLGMSFGEERAFSLNYGRLIDPGRFLSSVSDIMADPTKQLPLAALGITQRDMAGGTAATAVAVLNRVKEWVDKTDPRTMGALAGAMHLGDLGFSTEDLRRLRATTPAEFAGIRNQYTRDASALNLGAGTQRQWQDFAVQMSRAGQMIENVFVRGLSPLVPGLTRLSSAFADATRILLGSPTVKSWMKGAGEGLETFARYVGTPKFKQDVETFAAGLGVLASKIADLVRLFAPDQNNAGGNSDDEPGSYARSVIRGLGLPGGGPIARTQYTSPIGPQIPTEYTAPIGPMQPPTSLWERLMRRSQGRIDVIVHNNTGGSAVISASQAAQ